MFELVYSLLMEKVEIQSTKGKVAAVIHRPKVKTGGLAVLCPGYLDSKDYDHLLSLANDLADLGYTTVRFDPIGTWESEGDISDYTVTQYLDDVKSVIEHMLSYENYEKIILCGHSMGGFISILYAIRDTRISVVLAIMPPYSIMQVFNNEMLQKWEKEGFRVYFKEISNSQEMKKFNVPYPDVENLKQYNVLNEAENLKIPLILVAGELDTLISPENVRLIYDNANEPKQFILLKGVHHEYRYNVGEINNVNKSILASDYISK